MPSLWTSFDLAGTFVFALSGALVAARKEFDVVGLFVLAFAAGLGGGIIRDGLVDDLPPAALKNESYMVIVLAAAALVFFVSHIVERLNHSVRLLDALGLGFFVVVGTEKAIDADLGVLAAMFIGVAGATGGGVIRDLFASTTPLLLHQEIYALAALLGSAVYLIATGLSLPYGLAATLTIVTTFIVRAASIHFQLRAPRSRRRSP